MVKKLYTVRVELEVVAVGADEKAAAEAAQEGLKDMLGDLWPSQYEVSGLSYMPPGWDADCRPWGTEDDKTIADYRREAARAEVPA